MCLNNIYLKSLIQLLSFFCGGSSSVFRCFFSSCLFSCYSFCFEVRGLFLLKITGNWALCGIFQTSSTLNSTWVDSAVLGAFYWLTTFLPFFHHCLHWVVCKILIDPLIVNLDHRRIDASSKTFHFLKSKQAIGRCLIHFNVGEILHSLYNVLGSP